ncbi:sensor histidine kinase [Gordonia humi]|uniref:histidine kinase n=1 Tax=Gordonia humi TaxID=686429 RepID=A0A840F0S1_9ACTN|nr:ATP-binding protein [Gordonia humi]MBB4137471.1 two-component system CitB family sensor kinase [Gordonia humi]
MADSPDGTAPVRRPGRVPLVAQVLLLQIAVIVVCLVVGFGWHIAKVDDDMRVEHAERALAVARAVAGDPDVRRLLLAEQGRDLDPAALASGVLQREALDITRRTGVLFVVIANADGVRVAHPDPAEIGRPVSTDPGAVLAGQDVMETDRGTLGESVRGKAPVTDDAGDVVGFVSTGISTQRVSDATRHDIVVTVGLAAAALAVGVMGSALLARRWRRLTLGLEPDELVDLVGEQRAVLHSLADGVLAIDAAGRLRMVNDRARRLLDVDATTGTSVDDLGLTPRIRRTLDRPHEVPIAATVGDRVVMASTHRVDADGRDLGMVLSVVDRTDIENLTAELDTVRSLSEALRAQRHETANRFHVLGGLLRHGDVDEAVDYLDEITGSGGRSGIDGLANVAEPHLHAFLDAKAVLARERGVTVTLGPQTWVAGALAEPVAATTVLGNLLDNAVEAAGPGGGVDVELLTDRRALWITVADDGPGIVFDDPGEVFDEGRSSKDHTAVPGGRGMGLSLCRQICRRHGGDLRVADPGGPSASARTVFVADLPDAMTEGPHDD